VLVPHSELVRTMIRSPRSPTVPRQTPPAMQGYKVNPFEPLSKKWRMDRLRRSQKVRLYWGFGSVTGARTRTLRLERATC
jgi:hypothetical protein